MNFIFFYFQESRERVGTFPLHQKLVVICEDCDVEKEPHFSDALKLRGGGMKI